MTIERMHELVADEYRGMKTFMPSDLRDFPRKIGGPVKKIAIVCWSTYGGGAERASMLMADYFLSRGISVVWLHTWDIGDVKINHVQASFIRIPEDPVERVDTLLRILPEIGVDTCLFPDHCLMRTMMDIVVARSLGLRIIVAEHNCFFFSIDDGNPLVHVIREKVYPFADVVTALSPANVAWWHAVGLKNVVYMPNFLTFELEDRPLPTVESRRNEFLFVARICDRKGPDLVLRAFAKVITEPGMEDARMTFLGRFETPKYENYLRGLIRDLGLEARVSFEGEVRDVGPYYGRAKLLLMGSRMEGAPMVLGEAKAYGLPSVVFGLSYVDGVSESAGVIPVPYGDTDAMAKAIVGCIGDAERYARLSAAARTSLEGLRKERIVARWERVLSDIEEGREITDPMCEVPDDATMFKMTMDTLTLSIPMLDDNPLRKFEAQLQSERDGFKRHFDWHMNNMQEWVDNVSRERDMYHGMYDEIISSRSYRLGRFITEKFSVVRKMIHMMRRKK